MMVYKKVHKCLYTSIWIALDLIGCLLLSLRNTLFAYVRKDFASFDSIARSLSIRKMYYVLKVFANF